MTGLDVKDLLAAHEGEDYDLYAQTINPQFIKMLRAIGRPALEPRGRSRYLRLRGPPFPGHERRLRDVQRRPACTRIRQALIDTLETGHAEIGTAPASALSPVCWDAS